MKYLINLVSPYRVAGACVMLSLSSSVSFFPHHASKIFKRSGYIKDVVRSKEKSGHQIFPVRMALQYLVSGLEALAGRNKRPQLADPLFIAHHNK
jgi:hypothetical protein